jgi:hypothetical protein
MSDTGPKADIRMIDDGAKDHVQEAIKHAERLSELLEESFESARALTAHASKITDADERIGRLVGLAGAVVMNVANQQGAMSDFLTELLKDLQMRIEIEERRRSAKPASPEKLREEQTG